MAENGVKEAPKTTNVTSITILDSDDEREQTTDELFEGFIKAVEPFLKRKELLLLRVKFQALCSDFKYSSRFKDMLRRKSNQVHKADVYIHFNEVLNAIIRNAAVYGRKGLKTTQEKELNDDKSGGNNGETQESRHETLAGNFENIEKDNAMETTPLNQSNESIDNDVQFVQESRPSRPSSSGNFQNPSSSNVKRNIEREKMKMKRKKIIAKLEAKLKYTSDEIKKLSQAELSLDEMEYADSSYIMESRLKMRFNTIWNKLCKLKGRPTNTGRVIERSVSCKTSGFPAIDRAIGKFLKKRKGFPDIFDIRNILIRVNKKHGLGLTQGVQNDIAADILTDIGNKLQKKRKKDFEYNFGCHLTDDCLPSLDPALHNSELRQKLEENKKVNKDALDCVFQKYVHLGRVKGSRDHGTDSNPPSGSDSNSDESYQAGKRKERKYSSENNSKEKKKQKRNKNSSEKSQVKSSVEVSIISTTSATDMPLTVTESGLAEVENSNSRDEKNSPCSSNGEQSMVVDDEIPIAIAISEVPISVTEVEVPVLPEVEAESVQPLSKHDGKLEAWQDLSVVDDIEESVQPLSKDNGELEAQQDVSVVDDIEESVQPLNKHNGKLEVQQDLSVVDDIDRNKDVSFALNSTTSKKIESQIKAPSPRTKPKPDVNSTAQEQTNGFGHDDIIEIIDNDKESVESHNKREMNESSIQKQKPTFCSRKLLIKIQQLKENQLSKFEANKSLANSSVSGSNEKVDSCHSKRKATSVRHITQNQQHRPSSPLNDILHKQVPNKGVEQVIDSEGQNSESISKIPLTSSTSEFLPQKNASGLQESLNNCPSTTLKSNSTQQMDINNVTQEHRFSGNSEQSSSFSEFQEPKLRISAVSSDFSQNGKLNLPKAIETIIIDSDDEND